MMIDAPEEFGGLSLACGKVTGNRQRLCQAVTSLCSFRAKQQFSGAAERCAAYLGSARSESSLAYEAIDLLAAKRLLADASGQAGKYIF